MSYKFTFQLSLKLADDEYEEVPPGDDDCAICLERDGETWIKIDCGHLFHKKCLLAAIEQTRKRACPLCRCPLESDGSCLIL